jgi:hypothetical protein
VEKVGDLFARLLVQLFLEAIFELGADLGDFHSRAHQKFAAQEFMCFFFIGQFSGHAAILAILIPAEPPVRDGFRADVLKASKNRIFLGDLERLTQDLDVDQSLVWTKNLCGPTRANHFGYLRLT